MGHTIPSLKNEGEIWHNYDDCGGFWAPFLDIPIVFCSAVCSSHLFFAARTCSHIRGKPQPFLLARNDRNLDSNGQSISWDLVDLSNMLFRCSIFFVLCCLCPQWVNGHGFVKPRPRRSCHHSSECFPEATHGMSSWKTSGCEFHGCYAHRVSLNIHDIYWWYPDVSSMKFDKIWREITDIQPIWIPRFLDVRDLPWISRISTAREEKHRSPPRPVWNSVVKPGFNQHFPHEFVWEITIKTCKNPNLMANIFFP